LNGKAIRGIRETVNEVLNILTKEPGTKLKFELNSPHGVDPPAAQHADKIMASIPTFSLMAS
jgi:hypothetical protein